MILFEILKEKSISIIGEEFLPMLQFVQETVLKVEGYEAISKCFEWLCL